MGISYQANLKSARTCPPNYLPACFIFRRKSRYNIVIMVLDTVEIILAIVIAIGTVVSSAALGVRWLVKHYLQELKTNGGSSIKDQVNRLESRMDNADAWGKETYRKVEKLDHQIDDLYTKFIEYLSNNNK
jgi:hypothetical protein